MLEDLPVLVGGTLEFWEAVVNVGWIEVSANGLTIPEFDKYLSKSGKARVQAKERQAAYRNDSKLSRSQRYENVTTEQNRTEHINNPLPLSKKSKPSKASPKKPTVEIPPTLAGEKFAEAWARWVRYRSERRKPLTPSTASKHLAKAERMGVDVAVEAIDRAIDRSYEAFFAPDSKPDLFSGSAPVVRDVDAEKAALLKHSMEMEERRANAQRN